MRKFTGMVEERLRENPQRIDGFIETQFEEYAKDGDLGALLAALRTVSRVKGVAVTAQNARLSRSGLQKALSEEGNPRFESVNAILQAMGYRISTQPIEVTH